MDYLRNPEWSIKEQYGPSLIQQDALEHNCSEADNVENDVKDGESLSKVLFVEHLPLVKLSAPYQDKEPWLKCKAADKIPEGWQPQVLHKLAFPLNWKLEIDGEEDEVPDEIDSDRHRRYAWS